MGIGRLLGGFLALACLVALVPVQQTRAQSNFDRPGGDYTSSPLSSGDPADCALMCERDRRCRAWTFRYPSAGDSDNPRPSVAVCWLKNMVPERVETPATVSGVRGAGVVELRNRAIEMSTDRP